MMKHTYQKFINVMYKPKMFATDQWETKATGLGQQGLVTINLEYNKTGLRFYLPFLNSEPGECPTYTLTLTCLEKFKQNVKNLQMAVFAIF